ncbi:MLO-like protein 1 [Camellia lanceoleosa]|uniref:MLO-like protein 1 n=1 Tax=Camellia lanceoleosa TaxID=1840588 RepID=A0ACC0HRC8_9ERIC|nr:MLO-like protein 1 [Camellia lanceoleosa]
MGGGSEDGGGTTLEFTPTWVAAGVCTVIVGISLAVERLLHFTGKAISLIIKICVNQSVTHHLLPCKLSSQSSSHQGDSSSNTTETTSHHRRLLAEQLPGANYCAAKNKVPLLSVEALHHLHIFIFVLAIFHVTFRVFTVLFGVAKTRLWKHWEDSIAKDNYDTEQVLEPKLTDVHQHDVIKGRFLGIGKNSVMLGWLVRETPKFDFRKFMVRALENDDDFKKAVGWHTYVWIAFIPFILLLAVGTKLEHVISQLVNEVAEKHVAIEGELVVQPSDNHFWFDRPRIVLYLIHFILFQNAFEIAFFFWIWVQYGFDSCIMGQARYIVPRLVIGVFIQVLCGFSTLPLYAIVIQMETFLKKAIFEEHVQAGLDGWVQKVRRKKQLKAATNGSVGGKSTDGSTLGIQLGRLAGEESAPENISPTAAAAQGDTK